MEHKKSSNSVSRILLIVLGVTVLLLSIMAFYFYHELSNIKKNPNQVAQSETNQLVSQVGKLIDLPKDETPTVATVLDKSKLADQPFFANAQNGDKILIYTKAKKAIIYQPTKNILVNVGPITIDQKAGAQVALIDAGGNITEVTKKINDNYSGTLSVQGTTYAKNKNSVNGITVVDVSGTNADAASKLARTLGGSVGNLPSGETAPSGATLLVFVK
jgi:hypothetical protein